MLLVLLSCTQPKQDHTSYPDAIETAEFSTIAGIERKKVSQSQDECKTICYVRSGYYADKKKVFYLDKLPAVFVERTQGGWTYTAGTLAKPKTESENIRRWIFTDEIGVKKHFDCIDKYNF